MTPPASVSLLPLIRDAQLIGCLALGSNDPNRFSSDASTDFLQHFAAVIAVCLENIISRERLRQMGLTDALTGLNNRRYFDDHLLKLITQARATGDVIACLILDVDHFKRINDDYGHPMGDKALQIVARMIRAEIRDIDIVARYGGEEFVVLLRQSNAQQAAEIAERIRSSIAARELNLGDDISIKLSISIGTALLPRDPVDPLACARIIVDQADQALLQAKTGGRNRVVAHLAGA